MRTLLRWLAYLYPASWRKEHEHDLRGFLDDLEPKWQDAVDLTKGGLEMQLKNTSVRYGVVCALGGLFVAVAVLFSSPKQFVARGTVFLQPRDGVSDPVSVLVPTAIDGKALRTILDTHNLFPANGIRREDKLRAGTQIERFSKNAFRVSFRYPDATTAQQVTRSLEVMMANTVRSHQDLSTVGIEEPNLPQKPEPPNRIVFAGVGLLGGALLGGLTGTILQRVRPSS